MKKTSCIYSGLLLAAALASTVCCVHAEDLSVKMLAGEKWCIVMPPGRWRSDDGHIYVGPATVEVAAPLARLPYFEKEGN